MQSDPVVAAILAEAESDPDAIGLLLTGSRGAAVTILWKAAIDKQMKNEWNELELIVRSLTKLQPHFITPWLFQSWNLSYNVSVECGRIRDKYFYISRGVELLVDGFLRNQFRHAPVFSERRPIHEPAFGRNALATGIHPARIGQSDLALDLFEGRRQRFGRGFGLGA